MYDNLKKLIKIGMGPAASHGYAVYGSTASPKQAPAVKQVSPPINYTSYKKQITPFYKNIPGGVDAVVDSAMHYRQPGGAMDHYAWRVGDNVQQAMREQGLSRSDFPYKMMRALSLPPTEYIHEHQKHVPGSFDLLFKLLRKHVQTTPRAKFPPLRFTPESIKQQYPIGDVPRKLGQGDLYTQSAHPGVLGYITRGIPSLHADSSLPQDVYDSVLRHEAGHRAFLGKDFDTMRARRPVTHGWGDTYSRSGPETDVDLAQIKRQWALHTGQLVDTPEKAEQAIKWYMQNGYKLDPRDIRNRMQDKLQPRSPGFFTPLSPQEKIQQKHNLEVLKWRMPALVQKYRQHHPELQA